MADNNKFPNLKFNTPITIDDFDFQQKSIYTEVTERTKANIGAYSSDYNYYGIISPVRPTNVIANTTGTIYPLQIDFYNANDLTTNDLSLIIVRQGNAITQNGNLISLDADYNIRLLDGITAIQGENNFVIYAEYEIINDTTTNTVARTGLIDSKRTKKGNPIKVATYNSWLNTTTFTATRMANIVPIGFVTFMYNSTTSSYIYKEIDLTASQLQSNRPWFSACDIEHRNFKGSGSDTVPHAIGLNDLSIGDNPLYTQLITQNSIVYAKPKDVINCPGTLCYEDISANMIHIDVSGYTTGKAGAKYIKLQKYPHKILGCAGPLMSPSADDTSDLSLIHLPGTNILVLAEYEEWPVVPIRIWYTYVSVAAPDVSTMTMNGTTLTLKKPNENEIIISEGLAIDTDNMNTKIDFTGNTLFPQRINLYLNGFGEIIQSPQNIVCTTDLSTITGVQQNTNAILAPSKLKIGVYTNSTPLYFVIKLTGKDINSNTITEELTVRYEVSGSNNTVKPTTTGWSPVPPDASTPPGFSLLAMDAPSYHHVSGTLYKTNDYTTYYTSGVSNYGNFLFTANTFSELTSWQITSSTAGTGTYIQISADLNPYTTTTIRDYNYIADVLWTGSQIAYVFDRRTITNELIKEKQLSPANIQAIEHQSSCSVFFIEDYLKDPKYMDYNKSLISTKNINNIIPATNTYDKNIYTTRAIPVDENLILATGTSCNAAYLVIYTDNYPNFNIYTQKNPLVMCRSATEITPLNWANWTTCNLVSFSGLTNRLVYDVSDAFVCTTTNKIIKNQFKILGDFYGFAIYLTNI